MLPARRSAACGCLDRRPASPDSAAGEAGVELIQWTVTPAPEPEREAVLMAVDSDEDGDKGGGDIK